MQLTSFKKSILIFSTSFLLIIASVSAHAYEDSTSTNLKFSVLVTAQSSGSLEAMVVDDGSWFTKRKLVHTAVLVNHPNGDFLFDSGIGREYKDQMSVFNFFEQQLFKIENIQPARDQLEQSNYDFTNLFAVIPSHMHWDHASGLEDFKDVPIWLQEISHEEAKLGEPPGFLISQYDDAGLIWHYLTLNNSDYEGFSKSLDVFKDGSVILVDLSGHTHGQLGMFLNLPSGQRYLFIGDTTWSQLGVVNNKPRPGFVDWLVHVDTDYELNSAVIDQVHKLSLSKPDIVIVPAHDELVVQTLPVFPEFSK
jgi:N-acyl homoserine lactone hydrolase